MQGFSDEESAKDVADALDEFVQRVDVKGKRDRSTHEYVVGWKDLLAVAKEMKEAYERKT
jgi:hypothetical protein